VRPLDVHSLEELACGRILMGTLGISSHKSALIVAQYALSKVCKSPSAFRARIGSDLLILKLFKRLCTVEEIIIIINNIIMILQTLVHFQQQNGHHMTGL
jgi:hypothetical protein